MRQPLPSEKATLKKGFKTFAWNMAQAKDVDCLIGTGFARQRGLARAVKRREWNVHFPHPTPYNQHRTPFSCRRKTRCSVP